MEHPRKLQECYEKRMSFRKVFISLGMVNENKPLKQLSDEETFSALVNWSIHKLPMWHSMILRISWNGAIYQTILRKSQKYLRMGKIVRVTDPGGIVYDWPEETKYDSLDVSIIESSD